MSGRRWEDPVDGRRVTQKWLAGRVPWIVSKASRWPSDVTASGVTTHAHGGEKASPRAADIRGDVLFENTTADPRAGPAQEHWKCRVSATKPAACVPGE